MTIAPPDPQPLLLETAPSWLITKNAQARNAYGTIAQHLVCAALRLAPIPINGNYDVCFDAVSGSTYYEIKSVKAKSGKVVVYDWRMEKEAKVKVDVWYAVLLHNVRKSNGVRLLEEFIEGGLEMVVMPVGVVHEVARECALMMPKVGADPRMGYNRTGYREGYRNVPVQALRELCTFSVVRQGAYAGRSFKVEVWM